MQYDGLTISRKTVQRHMQEMGIAGISPGNLSRRRRGACCLSVPAAGRHQQPPQSGLGDRHHLHPPTETVAVSGGRPGLVFSRYVISWRLDQTLDIDFVLVAVDAALAQARPTIWNSDQGSHFTSPQYIERLLAAEVRISMDGKGRALDNIFTERLWRTLKYEEVYLHDYVTPKDACHGLSRYFDFYNHRRPHQSLGYRTPAKVYGS